VATRQGTEALPARPAVLLPVPALHWFLHATILAGLLVGWTERGWATALPQLGLFAIALVATGRVVARGGALHAPWLAAPLAIPGIAGLLQLVFHRTVYPWATEVATLDWFARLVAFWLGWHLHQRQDTRRYALAAWAWLSIALALLALLERLATPGKAFGLFPTGVGSSMGPFLYANQFARFVETTFPLVLFGALASGASAWFWLLGAGILGAAVVVSSSRMGVAILAAEGAWCLVTAARDARTRRYWRARLGLASAMCLALASAAGWEPLWRELGRPDQLGDRRPLTLATLEMARDRLGWGWGLGTWATVYPAYARFDDGLYDHQAHNDWAQWAAEGGLIVLVAMLMVAVGICRAAWRARWGVGLVGVLVHALVDYPFLHQRPAFGYYFFALAGMLIAEASGSGCWPAVAGPASSREVAPEVGFTRPATRAPARPASRGSTGDSSGNNRSCG